MQQGLLPLQQDGAHFHLCFQCELNGGFSNCWPGNARPGYCSTSVVFLCDGISFGSIIVIVYFSCLFRWLLFCLF